MSVAIVIVAWLLVAILVGWIAAQIVQAARDRARPAWRKLPTIPGLPLYVEYQFWLPMPDFKPAELSAALGLAVECLSKCFDHGLVCHVLGGAGILVYARGGYPADECTEAVTGSVSGTQGPFRRIAVEKSLEGLAHAIAHAIDRYARVTQLHHDWDRRGITRACEVYVAKLSAKKLTLR